MNTPIIQWVKEPELWDREKLEQSNAEYNEPLKVPLKEQQASAKETLYWTKPDDNKDYDIVLDDFWNESPSDIVAEEDKQEESPELLKQRKIEEWPSSPLVDWFVSQWLLDVGEGNSIKQGLSINWNLDWVEWVDADKLEQVSQSIEFLNWPEAKSKSLEKFNKDFTTDVDNLKQTVEWSKNGEQELIWQNKNLVQQLWENYFALENPEWWKETKDDAINRAFKTTLNELRDWKDFKRPDTFKDMKDIINNKSWKSSFKERFTELKKVDNLINKDQSLANNKQGKAFSNMKKGTEKQTISLQARFDNAKSMLNTAKVDKNKDNLQKIEENLQLIKEEVVSWEVFEWWDIDILLNELKDLKEAA